MSRCKLSTSNQSEVLQVRGRSLGDGAAFRHAGRPIVQAAARRPLVVVCSAPAGVTDLLLGLADARRAAATRASREALAATSKALRDAYRTSIVAARSARARPQPTSWPAEIDGSLAELASPARQPGGAAELTARTRDFVVSRGERLSAPLFAAALAAAGVSAEYVDALEISPPTARSGARRPTSSRPTAARKRLRPAAGRGRGPGRARVPRQRRDEDEPGGAPSARWPRWAAAAPT